MDVTITATGHTFWRIDDAIGAMLCEAFPEAFRRANSAPQTPSRVNVQAPGQAVHFGLGQAESTGQWFISASDGRTTLRFVGTPKELSTFDFWLCGKANRAPQELIVAYRDKYEQGEMRMEN